MTSRHRPSRILLAFLALPGSGLFLGVASCITVTGCSIASSPATVTRTLPPVSVPHVAAKGLDAETGNGSISVVRGSGTSVTIKAVVHAQTDERAAAVTVAATRNDAEALVVRAAWPGGKPLMNEGCDLTIEIPDVSGIKLLTTNGGIEVKGLGGNAALRTSNGAIEVTDHAGDVVAETSNGAITAVGVRGAFRASTTNGAVRASGLAAKVDASTTNGAVELALDPANPGPVTAATSNGRVLLTVGEAFRGSLRADTNNGDITCETPASVKATGEKGHRVLDFGGTGNSSLKSSNGAVTVRQIPKTPA